MKKLIVSLLCYLIINPIFSQDKYQMTVTRDGTGDYTTIQAAIDACKAFPDSGITIFIRNGIYKEKIVVPSCNTRLSLVGESRDSTIITFDDYFNRINRGRNSTFFTYTLLVEADDFSASDLTIENSAGLVGQAVALHIEGNRCIIRNCRVLGNQDSLYLTGENSCQYFISCYIEGTTDFIFGSATALFDSCIVHCKADSYITAASTPEGKKFGFVFRNCRVTAAGGVKTVYLGRPWRDYAKVVFIQCTLGEFISPQGWSNWANTSRDKTAFYAEYKNTGPGFTPEKRVPWSHQLSSGEARKYTLANILKPILIKEPGEEEWTRGR